MAVLSLVLLASLVTGITRQSLNKSSTKINTNTSKAPTRFEYLLYPGFAPLDVFGPVQALEPLSYIIDANFTVIAESLDAVHTGPPPGGPSFWPNQGHSIITEGILPTHTFETAPPLDVLLIPGSYGSYAPSPLLDSTISLSVRVLELRLGRVSSMESMQLLIRRLE
jgi:hypothetical protein